MPSEKPSRRQLLRMLIVGSFSWFLGTQETPAETPPTLDPTRPMEGEGVTVTAICTDSISPAYASEVHSLPDFTRQTRDGYYTYYYYDGRRDDVNPLD